MKLLRTCLVFFLIYSCSLFEKTFTQVSYFSNDTVAYYTFNINEQIDLSNGLNDELKARIKEHGTQQAVADVVTATFYFHGNAPRIEEAIGGLNATSIIQEARPVAVLWAMPDGRTQLIENPG